jgi:hypothetical protein
MQPVRPVNIFSPWSLSAYGTGRTAHPRAFLQLYDKYCSDGSIKFAMGETGCDPFSWPTLTLRYIYETVVSLAVLADAISSRTMWVATIDERLAWLDQLTSEETAKAMPHYVGSTFGCLLYSSRASMVLTDVHLSSIPIRHPTVSWFNVRALFLLLPSPPSLYPSLPVSPVSSFFHPRAHETAWLTRHHPREQYDKEQDFRLWLKDDSSVVDTTKSWISKGTVASGASMGNG